MPATNAPFAGAELNAEVSEKIMGVPACRCKPRKYDPDTGHCCDCGNRAVPRYSQEMWAAWLVVEKFTIPIAEADAKPGRFWLDGLGFDCCPDGQPDVYGVHGRWRCHLTTENAAGERIEVFETAETAPLAICRAALAAVAQNPALLIPISELGTK